MRRYVMSHTVCASPSRSWTALFACHMAIPLYSRTLLHPHVRMFLVFSRSFSQPQTRTFSLLSKFPSKCSGLDMHQ
jgi:hypothetical protein